ncbi:MAG TPA: hypothetical protein VMH39_08830 [Gemmatimonadaceae bacterium]|nr:hypothetical protein [Gemmatimonadaceae bacterium]
MRLVVSSLCAAILALPAHSLHAQTAPQPGAQATGSAPNAQATVMPVDFHPHESTALPEDARFEIIQSSIAAKLTLRLDRFSGEVDQMVSRPDSSIGWQAVPREVNPVRDQEIVGRANYQIFSSGITIRFTFLINSNTGATWQLYEDPNHGWFWLPIY